MSETHSPAPWKLHEGGTSVTDKNGKLVASCGYLPNLSRHEEMLNAAMASAAPEMYKILIDILHTEDVQGLDDEIWDAITTTLLKARGIPQ